MVWAGPNGQRGKRQPGPIMQDDGSVLNNFGGGPVPNIMRLDPGSHPVLYGTGGPQQTLPDPDVWSNLQDGGLQHGGGLRPAPVAPAPVAPAPIQTPLWPPPGWSSSRNQITGLEPWGYEGWEGTALDDPTQLPEPIQGDWGLSFRPGDVEGAYQGYRDWAISQGQDPLPEDRFNDAQYIEAFGAIPDEERTRYGADPEAWQQAGYTFGLDPQDTANRNWALDYNIYNPQGEQTPWALSGQNPYGMFPWIDSPSPPQPPPPQPPPRPECGDGEVWNPIYEQCMPQCGDGEVWDPVTQQCVSSDLPTGTTPTPQQACEAGGGVWNGFECEQDVSGTSPSGIVRPTHELPPGWEGAIDPTYDAPFAPPEYLEQTTVPVGEDPLSQLTTANLASLLTTGGVAPTPLAGNIEQTLQDVLLSRGAGAEAVSPMGQAAIGQLENILEAQGHTARTGLGQSTAEGLQDIITQRGAAPTPQVGQDVTQHLQEIIARHGAAAAPQVGQDVTQQIQNLLATGGALPSDPQREAIGIEAARSPLDILRRAQLSQGQAALASQGLVGSGAGQEFGQRLEERLAPMYTQAAQNLELQRREREQDRYSQAMTLGAQQAQAQTQARDARYSQALAMGAEQAQQQTQARDTRLSAAMAQAQAMSGDEAAARQNQFLTAITQATGISREQAQLRENRLQNAMSLATGMSEEQSRNILATAATVNARQQMLGDMALQSLDRNMAWNQFLANYGLDRAKTLEAMQTGRIQAIMPILEMYMRAAQQAGVGYALGDD